jgi:thioredoxin 1
MSKFNELIQGEIPVVVNFYADWAPTCDEVGEQLKDFKKSQGDAIKMIKIDFDKNEVIARKLNVIGVPTVILFKEGTVLYKTSGEINLDEMTSKLS